MPFFGVRPPPSLCALAVHIGRLLYKSFYSPRFPIYRSRHRAGRLFKSRRARCALTILDALSNIGQDEALTERTHFASMAFCQASAEVIKDVGRWRSNAYLRYIRECRGQYMSYMTQICNTDVDDMEADHLDLDAHDLDDSDYM